MLGYAPVDERSALTTAATPQAARSSPETRSRSWCVDHCDVAGAQPLDELLRATAKARLAGDGADGGGRHRGKAS